MNICFEIDGVISTVMEKRTDVSEVGKQEIIKEAKEVLKAIKAAGHNITLYTQRDVCVGLETEIWLQKNGVPYDRIMFNRPRDLTAFFAPDAYKFSGWSQVKAVLAEAGILKGDVTNDSDSKTTGVIGKTDGDTAGRREDTEVVVSGPNDKGSTEQEKETGIQVLKQGQPTKRTGEGAWRT